MSTTYEQVHVTKLALAYVQRFMHCWEQRQNYV